MSAKIHPLLLDQLDGGSSLVQAIVQLRYTDEKEGAVLPEAMDQLAAELLARVAREVGHSAVRSNVLRNVATVIIEAAPDFIRSLISQPEIASALPNQTADSVAIPPVKRRPA